MTTMPALFVGHGNPMNAILENSFTRAWNKLGRVLPRPKAILAISAHWYVAGSGVTVNTAPRTIHDFGGFPKELFAYQYPAPGDPELAERVRQLLAPVPVEMSENWGLDHGTWAVLCHVYPKADVPVVQLSLDRRISGEEHLELARRLRPLREEGVLILGSGNIVHNLREYQWGKPEAAAFDWAEEFEAQVRKQLLAGDQRALAHYEQFGRAARLAVPTPEHYLPLLYTVGTQQTEEVSFPVEGIEGGALSMLAVQVG